VDVAHVGWVIVPRVGAVGVASIVIIEVAITSGQLPAATIVFVTV
jgi:hypothetical protein